MSKFKLFKLCFDIAAGLTAGALLVIAAAQLISEIVHWVKRRIRWAHYRTKWVRKNSEPEEVQL